MAIATRILEDRTAKLVEESISGMAASIASCANTLAQRQQYCTQLKADLLANGFAEESDQVAAMDALLTSITALQAQLDAAPNLPTQLLPTSA